MTAGEPTPAAQRSGERVTVQYCPYCGEEWLRPHEASHGAWECRGCARVFAVRFLGLAPAAFPAATETTTTATLEVKR